MIYIGVFLAAATIAGTSVYAALSLLIDRLTATAFSREVLEAGEEL